jgi:hypothetical protein
MSEMVKLWKDLSVTAPPVTQNLKCVKTVALQR